MAVTFLEPGSAATFDLSFWDSTGTGGTGTITSVSQAIFNSIRSIALASGASNGTMFAIKNAVIQDAGARVSFGLRYSGTLSPTGNGGDFMNLLTSGSASVYCLAITSGGLLRVLGNTGNILGTGTTVLNANVDYRISFAYTVSSTTVNTFTLYINGNPELTLTNVTLGTTGTVNLGIGVGQFNTFGSNVTLYVGHLYVDNLTANDPGNIFVTAKRPVSNGTSIQFTTRIGAGGSGYGSGHSPQVNERALSTTNGWSLNNTTKSTEEYNIEARAVGDVDLTDATIVDYMGWISSQVNSTSNTPVHHIIVNGVATTITQTTSAKIFTKIAGSAIYPAGSGTDIGIDAQYTTLAHLTSLFEAGVVVAYIPKVTQRIFQTRQSVNRAATY